MSLETAGTIFALVTSIIFISSSVIVIIRKVGKAIKYKATRNKKAFKIEKNAVILAPFPLVKSPKGYIYGIDQDPKTGTLFCGNCYTATSKRIPLDKTGGRFSKELVCPDCQTIYSK